MHLAIDFGAEPIQNGGLRRRGGAIPDLPLHRHRILKTASALTLGLALLLGPLALGIGPARVSAAPRGQVAFTFTPRVTEIPRTSTPAPTGLATLATTAPSATAVAPTPEATPSAPSAPSCLASGDTAIGYDFIEGSPPMWRICYEGQALMVSASDPTTTDLLNAFRAAAERRARAIEDAEQAREVLTWATAGGAGGLISFVAGGFVAAASCAATPLTFYALGGTGWICVGSAGASIGGFITLVASGAAAIVANGQVDSSEEAAESAAIEAGQYFGALHSLVGP